jgi:hypothetical protein
VLDQFNVRLKILYSRFINRRQFLVIIIMLSCNVNASSMNTKMLIITALNPYPKLLILRSQIRLWKFQPSSDLANKEDRYQMLGMDLRTRCLVCHRGKDHSGHHWNANLRKQNRKREKFCSSPSSKRNITWLTKHHIIVLPSSLVYFQYSLCKFP